MFYELTILVRPDTTMRQIQDCADKIKELTEKEGGSIEASEYEGFRTLAYPIEKRSKAHYICFGLKANNAVLKALQHYLKFHREILRFLFVRQPDGLTFPTPLHHSSLEAAIAGIGPSSSISASEETAPVEESVASAEKAAPAEETIEEKGAI